MSNKWHEIWGRRSVDSVIILGGDEKEIFLELKRADGYDSTGISIKYEQWYSQYIQIKNELEFSSKKGKCELESVFEVGCGSGANLYLFQKEGIRVGGIDYSQALIDIAKTVLTSPIELLCVEASNVPTDIMYDAVLSNSVFSYFESYEYVSRVLKAMYNKAKHAIGITDIHDINKKDDFIKFRKSIINDFEEKYKNYPKFFYDKGFFLEFAEEHNMSIKFSIPDCEGYWNNDYTFDCYMTKN